MADFTREDVERAAKMLSKAQREAALWFNGAAEREWYDWLIVKPRQSSLLALVARDLVDGVTGLNGFVKGRLTPLGLAVRAYLLETTNAKS